MALNDQVVHSRILTWPNLFDKIYNAYKRLSILAKKIHGRTSKSWIRLKALDLPKCLSQAIQVMLVHV